MPHDGEDRPKDELRAQPTPVHPEADHEALRRLTERPGPGPHRTTLRLDAGEVATLADLPPARGGLLFVGLSPSPVSIAAGHYHQGRQGHLFWRRLIRAGILPGGTVLETADDALVAMGHGITDLDKRPAGTEEVGDAQLTAGVGPLRQKIAIWRPGAIVFVHKRAAEISAGRSLEARWGVLENVALAGRPCVLMPGPHAPPEEVDAGLNLLRNLLVALPR